MRPIPSSFRRRDTAAGWKLILPWRTISAPRRSKVYLYLLGAAGLLLGSVGLVAWAVGFRAQGEREPLYGLFFMAAIMALYLLAVGLSYVWTRTIVEVTRDGLRVIEQYGLFKSVRERPWLRVCKLVTHQLARPHANCPSPAESRGAIEVVGHGAQTLWFAHDYPRDWLLAVTEHLAAAGQVPSEEASSMTTEEARVQSFFQHARADVDIVELARPPADCRCRVQDREGVLTLMAPAPSFRQCREKHSLLLVPVVALGFLGFTGYAVSVEGLSALNAIVPVAVCFLLGGVLLAVSQINLCRWTLFRVDDEQITVVEKHRFGGERRQTLQRNSVAAIRAEEAYPYDAQAETMRLRIVSNDGPAIVCLEGRQPEELWWIATILRRALSVPAIAGHSATTV